MERRNIRKDLLIVSYWKRSILKKLLAFVVCALILATGAASAQTANDFYRGKVVQILVGYAPGGGYDTYARAVAKILGHHLPGNPSVMVQNMPGADGLVLANHMAQRAPRDGTTIATTNRALAVAPMLELLTASSVRYDPTKFNWLANLSNEVSVFIVRKDLGIRNLEDLRTRQIKVGATGLTSNNAVYPYVINNLLGTVVSQRSAAQSL